MRRLQTKTTRAWIEPLIQVLNGESVILDRCAKGRLNEAATNRIKGLCADLAHLDLVCRMIQKREPNARDATEGRTLSWPDFQFDNPESDELNKCGRKLQSQVNAQLRYYQQCPGIMLVADGPGLRLSKCEQISTSNFLEQGCVCGLMDLLEQDTLRRLRLCFLSECRRWFFAAIDHQKYCSENCRQRQAAHSERFKEKRRLYMRDYRIKERLRDASAKRLTRRK